jgi:hypothetical protein
MRVATRIRKWLTGPRSDPSIRARYWLEIEKRPRTESRVQNALRSIGRTGWAASLLRQQWPDGHWGPPGTSGPELFRPKFVTTHWVAGVLADLGMNRADPRVRKAAELILDRYGEDGGDAPLDYRPGRGGELCVTGMVTRTLIRFGYLDHPAVQRTISWIVRTQKSDGGWHHSPSSAGTLDAWEGLAALAEIPEDQRAEGVRQSIVRGAEFFLRHRLMEEGKGRYAPWFRIHYPNQNYYDVMVGLRILTRLGYGEDRRLAPALNWLRRKQIPEGGWALDSMVPDLDPALAKHYYENEVVYPMMLEPLHGPSQWATVEALAILALTESNEN